MTPAIWLQRRDSGGHVYITVSCQCSDGEWIEVIRELFSTHGETNPGEISHIVEGDHVARTMETALNQQLIATGCVWYVSYRPSLDAREEGDEWDYPAADHHFECEIIMDMEQSAHGYGDTEDEAKAGAVTEFRNKIN